ncbi:MAG: hypothetical protein J7K83_03640 [Candidatus Aenigmarchaeota archaeon]|nr:hypothetical protein [Candidatus Aenigmarchaeota archaeon]
MVSWGEALKYALKISSAGSLLKLAGTILSIVGVAFLSKLIFSFVLEGLLNLAAEMIQQLGQISGQQITQFNFMLNYTKDQMIRDGIIGILTYFFGSMFRFMGEKVPEIKYTVELIKKELEKR